jgi:hypothetical protein
LVDGTHLLAELRKIDGEWQGRIPPSWDFHLPPQKLSSKAMQQAERYIERWKDS